jgi:Flp pilus assembly protein TadB
MPIMFAFFDFAERAGKAIWANPVLRWIVLIATGLFIHRLWLWRRDSRVRKEITKDIVDQIEEQTNERVEEARKAARSTDDLNADQLRKLRAKDPNNRSRLP